MAANSSRPAGRSKDKAPSSKSRRRRRKDDPRPKKPVGFPDFPLYAHPLGYWSKKVNGKIVHFGRWGKVVNGKLTPLPYDPSWREAYANYKARIDDPRLGRGPGTVITAQTPATDECSVGALRARFLTAKSRALDAGEINRRTYDEYKTTTTRLVKQFGEHQLIEDLTAADFEELRAQLASNYGPTRLGNEVQKVRTFFKYGYESGLLDKPVRYGPQFVKPRAGVMRKHRAKNGKRLLTVEECRRLLDATEGKEVTIGKNENTGKLSTVKLDSNPQLRAMLLLGLNCGFGNHDVATLPLDVLDLKTGWIDYPRPKSGIERRCPLWAETVTALKDTIASRPKPKEADAEELVFVTSRGRAWLSCGIANPVSVGVRKLFKQCGVNGKRGLGFYTLRHVFRTVADGARDQVAANLIMGHSDPSMAAVYREHIDEDRLRAVVQYVRSWLFGKVGAS